MATSTNRKKTIIRKSKPQETKSGPAALALGCLIGFYRRIDGRAQRVLGSDASLHPSEIALYESGQRLPNFDTLTKISKALGLDAFQERQLHAIAEYREHGDVPGHKWLMPDDVLHGIPMFLRKMDSERKFQKTADISEMWIVTHKPLALEGDSYEMLKKRLTRDRTKFVYFVGGSAGEESFQALWSRLRSESPKLRSLIPEKLQCVLSPPSFGLYHFGICNPGQQSRMFGRGIMYQNGLPVGFYGMDSLQVASAYQLLDPAYDLCKTKKGERVTTDYGTFQLLEPKD